MAEERKAAAAVVIPCPEDPSRILVVRRPEAPGEELPGIWGLPAASQQAGESLEETARRIGWQKLGMRLRPGKLIAQGVQRRPGYELVLSLYEAATEGGEPLLTCPEERQPGITYYTAWQWAEPQVLQEGARRGSVCSRLLLEFWQGCSPGGSGRENK
jgi:ADP-ribose pyrophosphatase YjhB (NUDIX family)